MKYYEEQGQKKLLKMYCNCCGRQLKVENGMLKEGCMMYHDTFGYFSEKDGEVHNFDLCETCYDKITASFKIPVKIKEQELLLERVDT